MVTYDPEMTVLNRVHFPNVFSTGSTFDESIAAGETLLKLTATANFDATNWAKGNRVILGRGTVRQEVGTIASIDAGVSITLDAATTYNHTIDKETTTDIESAAGGDNKILKVTATTDFAVGESVKVDTGLTHEATYIIASIQSGDSLTMTTNLLFTHDATEKVNQVGIAKIVEVIWAGLSEVICKKHYKKMALFVPPEWKTAKITFLGSPTVDGVFTEVDSGIAGTELTVADTEASKTVGLDGILMECISNIPYLKLRSGVSGTEVDQYANADITYCLMR